MSFLLKDPEAVLDYAVDWGAEYLSGDALLDSSWSVSPEEPGGAAIAGSQFDLLVATVQVAGGLPGKIYRVTNHAPGDSFATGYAHAQGDFTSDRNAWIDRHRNGPWPR